MSGIIKLSPNKTRIQFTSEGRILSVFVQKSLSSFFGGQQFTQPLIGV